MAVTVEQIVAELGNRGALCSLSGDEWRSVVTAALRAYSNYAPVRSYSAFKTVKGRQGYRLWDPNDLDLRKEVSPGVFDSALPQNSISVQKVLWNPSGTLMTSIWPEEYDIIPENITYNEFSFNHQADFVVFEQKIAEWINRFGAKEFQIFGGLPGDSTAELHLYPIPDGEHDVLVRYYAAHTLDTISPHNRGYHYLMMFVEAYAAEAMASKASETAGMEFGGFIDGQANLRYWQSKAERLFDRAYDAMAGLHGQVLRT